MEQANILTASFHLLMISKLSFGQTEGCRKNSSLQVTNVLNLDSLRSLIARIQLFK
jgi:hypothetical protein